MIIGDDYLRDEINQNLGLDDSSRQEHYIIFWQFYWPSDHFTLKLGFLMTFMIR